MYNSASEIIAIHKKNGGDIANFGAPSDYDHLYVITQGDLTLAYAARGGKCLVEIPKKEFNKRQKHADIEYINVSLDSDAALLPPYCWRARDSDAFRALFQLPELCQKNATLLMLFVLCIAAPLLSILYPLFGGQHCRCTYRTSDCAPGSAGTPVGLRRSGRIRGQALGG